MTSGRDREHTLKKLFGLPVDDVIPLTIQDYKDALSEVLEIAKSINARSVFTYGNISVPGISDLDILIVSENPFPVSRLSRKTRWIMSHTPIVVKPGDIEQTSRLLDTRNLKLVWGRAVEFPEPTIEDLRTLAVRHMVWKTMSLHKKLTTRDLRARNLLLHLHALRYSFREIGEGEPEFFRRVSYLREKWFDLTEEDKLTKLLLLTYESLHIIQQFFSFFERESADNRETGNWLWVEGDVFIPIPSKPFKVKGRLAETLYYLNIYTARIPGGALKYVNPYPVAGWRGILTGIRRIFKQLGEVSRE